MNKSLIVNMLAYITIVVAIVILCRYFELNSQIVFSNMSDPLTYLGILSSVSLAILGMLGQLYEKKSMAKSHYHIALEPQVKDHITTETMRILMMVFPIISNTIFSITQMQNSYTATVQTALTGGALLVSLSLPLKYARLLRSNVDAIYDEAEKKRVVEKNNLTNELDYENSDPES